MTLATKIEQTIQEHRSPTLEDVLPAEFLLPHYGGYSIANIPATVARLLGVELREAAPPLAEELWADLASGVRTVLLIVIDALGYRQLVRWLDEEDSVLRRFARAGRLVPITSVFPSTTVAALTTLWTGRPPGDHGIVGTKMLLGEQGVLADMLKQAPAGHPRHGELVDWGWNAEDCVPVPGVGEQLTAAGVQTVAHTHWAFIGSPLARLFMRGMAQVDGHMGFSDMWINLRQALSRRQEGPLFISTYWGGIDGVGHMYGAEGERFRAALRHLARSLDEDFLAPLPAQARDGTLLMITADHGQTRTRPERAVKLSDHPALRRMLLLPPAAEPRAATLYVRPGQAGAVQSYVAEHLGDRFLIIETERAVEAGLFGPPQISPEVRARLGDLLLLAHNDSQLVGDEHRPHQGHHGSLTAEEMLAPLLLARLDAL